MRDQKRVLAVAHDVVRDQSTSVEEGRGVELSRRRCVSMMTRVVLRMRELVTHAASEGW